MSMLISPAFAQASADTATAASGSLASFLPIILIFGIFYFMLIRPQQKKFKQHQEMVKSLKRGDKVVTGGGIIGTVIRVDDEKNTLQVEIAPDVKVQVTRSTVTEVLSRTEPAA